MYEEAISIQRLKSEHMHVRFAFDLQNDVHVRCSKHSLCETNSDTLPPALTTLILDSMTSNFSVVSTPGGWQRHFWGPRSAVHPDNTIVAQSPGGTILLAAAISPTTRHHTQYDALRSSLASTLGLPIGPTFSDLSNNGRRNPASISPTSPGCYSQFFPRVHSNPDTWKYWSHRLLPCRDKAGIATLLSAQSIRSSLWHSLSLDVQLVQTPTADTDHASKAVCGIDQTKNGSYSVRMSVQLEMVVPVSAALSNSFALEKTMTTGAEGNKGSGTKPAGQIDMDIVTAAKHASYSKDQSIMCRIPGAVAPRVRYHHTQTSHSEGPEAHTQPSPQLQHEITLGMDTAESMDAFWQAVAAVNVNTPTETQKHRHHIEGILLDRTLYDSRSLAMTVHTVISLPATSNSNAGTLPSRSPVLTFTEVVSQNHDIDLRSYIYRLISRPDGAEIAESTGFIADLPSFRWTSQDCAAHDRNCTAAASFNSIQPAVPGVIQGVPDTQQQIECARTYVFELPDLPSGGLFSTMYHANKHFISREAQPVDASRGALVPPSILTICDTSTANVSSVRRNMQGCKVIYTDSFLVTTPIPDASMPYNVITLVSTLLAFFMGSFINALLKKPSATAANKVLGSTSNDSHQETNSGTQRLE